MDKIGVSELRDYIYERDKHEFALGDTVDMKTGLILAALTFLAIQSGGLISMRPSPCTLIGQGISVSALVLGGILAVWELRPRDYLREAKPDKYYKWTDELMREGISESEVPLEVRNQRLSEARQRVVANAKINELKSRLLNASFYCVAIALAANLCTLAMRLF